MTTSMNIGSTAPIRMTERRENRLEELDDLLGLLLDHRADDSLATLEMARFVAQACMGDNHLWQDMGLPSRDALNALMQSFFPALHGKNSANMKWKKFFYKQLCERADIFLCKAPSCGVCVDYEKCFGPET
jgi:nitrogen fixation protein NifQ